MAETMCLAEQGTSNSQGIESLVAQSINSNKPSMPGTQQADLLGLMHMTALAGRAGTINHLEMICESALSSVFGLEGANVKVFSSADEAHEYEAASSQSGKGSAYLKITGNSGSIPHTLAVIECPDVESAERAKQQKPEFDIFMANFSATVENKLALWIDKKTGLYTDSYRDSCLDQRAKAPEAASKGYGVIWFDVDDFKKYNDTYGHETADKVLGKVGEAVRKSIRSDDIAIRYGASSDEFVVYAMGCSQSELRVVGERVKKAVAEYQVAEGADPVTLSMGLAHSTEIEYNADSRKTIKELTGMAEDRVYEAKAAGKDMIVGPEYVPADNYLSGLSEKVA